MFHVSQRPDLPRLSGPARSAGLDARLAGTIHSRGRLRLRSGRLALATALALALSAGPSLAGIGGESPRGGDPRDGNRQSEQGLPGGDRNVFRLGAMAAGSMIKPFVGTIFGLLAYEFAARGIYPGRGGAGISTGRGIDPSYDHTNGRQP